MAVRYIVASSRPWNGSLAARLSRRTSDDYILVTSPAELAAALSDGPAPRYILVAHWSEYIPETIWSKHETVIFHMTDLPYGRGGSPLQNLIARGHTETMMSALRCSAEVDAGPVYLRRPLSLHGSAEEIFIRADAVIEEMIVELVSRQPTPVPQQGNPVAFKRRRPQDSAINGDMTLQQLYDHVRMLDAEGYPHALLEVGRLRIEFTKASRRVDRIEAQVTIRDTRSAPDETAQ